MTYTYKCPKCSTTQEIQKPMSESSKPEYCEKCKTLLIRSYGNVAVVTGDGFKS